MPDKFRIDRCAPLLLLRQPTGLAAMAPALTLLGLRAETLGSLEPGRLLFVLSDVVEGPDSVPAAAALVDATERGTAVLHRVAVATATADDDIVLRLVAEVADRLRAVGCVSLVIALSATGLVPGLLAAAGFQESGPGLLELHL
jgi:hypothetical protein